MIFYKSQFFLKFRYNIKQCIENNNYFHIRTSSLRNIWLAPHLYRFLSSRRMISVQTGRKYHRRNLQQKQNHVIHLAYWNQWKLQERKPKPKPCLHLNNVTNPSLILHTLIELAWVLADLPTFRLLTFAQFAEFLDMNNSIMSVLSDWILDINLWKNKIDPNTCTGMFMLHKYAYIHKLHAFLLTFS